VQSYAAADGMSDYIETVEAQCRCESADKIDELRQSKPVLDGLAPAEAREVGYIDAEVFRQGLGVFTPGSGALTSAVDND